MSKTVISQFAGHLVILDEIQRQPDLFPLLRSLIDERRQIGERSAQFLLLCSASPDLLQQSAETLAGRISYLELTPLKLTELVNPVEEMVKHWFVVGIRMRFSQVQTMFPNNGAMTSSPVTLNVISHI